MGEGGGQIGVGTNQDGIQSPRKLYKAPTDYTKPQQHYTKPDIFYKDPPKKQIIQRHNISDNTPKHQTKTTTYGTKVAINSNFTYNIKYLILKMTCIKGIHINKKYQIGPYRAIILPCLFPCGGPSWSESLLAIPETSAS